MFGLTIIKKKKIDRLISEAVEIANDNSRNVFNQERLQKQIDYEKSLQYFRDQFNGEKPAIELNALLEYRKSEQFTTDAKKHVFMHQSISKDEQFAKMKMNFIDSKGERYFSYTDVSDIPQSRIEATNIIILEITNRISNVELDALVKTVNDIISSKKNVDKLKSIGHLMYALEQRRKCLYEPVLLFRLACALYINENQDPTIWDEVYEENKIKQLKADTVGGLHDFFCNAGLRKYLPALNQSKKELQLQLKGEHAELNQKEFTSLLATLQSLSIIKSSNLIS